MPAGVTCLLSCRIQQDPRRLHLCGLLRRHNSLAAAPQFPEVLPLLGPRGQVTSACMP